MAINIAKICAAALFAFLVAVFPVLPAKAGWTVAFEPDLVAFKVSDVVTGRLRIGFVANSSWTGTQPAKFIVRSAAFQVVGPDGTKTMMSERYQDKLSRYVALSPGEEVMQPVCLAKWEGSFVFDAAGDYEVVAMVSLITGGYGKTEIVSSSPVSISVSGVGPPPDAYVEVFRHLPDICGCFRYGLALYGVRDLGGVSFGDYDESLYAFMTYQMWHSGVASYVMRSGSESSPLVEFGMSLCRERSGGAPCRGSWMIERLAAMGRAAKEAGISFPDLELGDGDVVF